MRCAITSSFAVALLWPCSALAQVETPRHRVEFTVSPGLSKCNDYDAFYGILTNWIAITSLDPTAKRKVVVTMKRLPDGGKLVDLSTLDPDGAKVASESHAYAPTEECFKVLYWTAFDTARLLRATITADENEQEKPVPITPRVVFVPLPQTTPEKQGHAITNPLRIDVDTGAIVVFGVARNPAFGVNLSHAYKLGNWWSAMVGARGAIAMGDNIDGNRVDVMNVTGVFGPCGRVRWASACALGSINVIKRFLVIH